MLADKRDKHVEHVDAVLVGRPKKKDTLIFLKKHKFTNKFANNELDYSHYAYVLQVLCYAKFADYVINPSNTE